MAAPRVVLFRHAPIDIDSRAKKFATTLQRGGYEPIVISLEAVGATAGECRLGDDGIRVIRVPIVRRPAAAVERVDNIERRRIINRQRRVLRERIRGLDGSSAKSAAKWLVQTGKVSLLKAQSVAEDFTYKVRIEQRRRAGLKDPFIVDGVERNLPVVFDIDHTLTDLLVSLEPDVLHAHHPQVLLAAREALARLRAQGRDPKFYYDARENFAGIPGLEQGLRAAHEALIASEGIMIGKADATSTVSEPIADVLRENYHLAERPSVFLNMPPYGQHSGMCTVREAAGLGPDVPLVVYSGTMSWARGIETIIEGIRYLPMEAHLVVVSVPLPHPMIPKLEAYAVGHGVADRLHFVGPVGQNELLYYLSGADVAVHPLPGGSPNHDAAMPNKLFEYLHAGLPLVVSDAKLMAQFVNEHGVGRVFTSNDPRSFGEQVGLELANPSRQAVAEVARRYSWQAQEVDILKVYGRLTGWPVSVPEGEFGSLEVKPA